jgi:hypothetical protein
MYILLRITTTITITITIIIRTSVSHDCQIMIFLSVDHGPPAHPFAKRRVPF